FAVWLRPRVLRDAVPRALIVALLGWNVFTTATTSMDGWCLRFVTPGQLYRATGQVPHSWDVRADWRTSPPMCSAIMRRSYDALDEFPIWFYNLPPADEGMPAGADTRPPLVRLSLSATGYINATERGTLRIEAGEDIRTRLRIDDREYDHASAIAGVSLEPGPHRVVLDGELERDRWSMRLFWNDRDLWTAVTATQTSPTSFDELLRPWARYLSPALVLAFLVYAAAAIVRRAASPLPLTVAAAAAGVAGVVAAIFGTGAPVYTRLGALVVFVPALIRVPARLRNGFGASLLLGVPFLCLFVALGLSQIGRVTLYSSGDDWWMFQRYGYRIFMEGYWLEGGQITFWFQPLYRWISGALHMAFGDSSVGELWWDAACAGIGAFFAFVITRRVAGYRWAMVAAAMTLAILVLGPGWYLFGRGLSELSSMGFIYAAALTAMRARRGHPGAMAATALLCALAFYTRLNNLPMVCAIVVFAFPTRTRLVDAWRVSVWWRLASRESLLAVSGGVMVGMWLFTWRTYHYTGFIDMFHGTQADDRSVWKSTFTVAEGLREVAASVMMVITMNDPAAFDARALPIIGGIAAALFGLLGMPRLRSLPLNASVLALSGLTGAIVARGSAYPGRFSLHLIPAAVTVCVCALALLISARRTRSMRPALQPRETTSALVSQSPMPG
ncbi:MAG TPA: hypothetical protein VNT81_18365, partial [Vicinamibacterales bacterium]|nr:hypothetical protein [Vicinamibacterales bacterium]